MVKVLVGSLDPHCFCCGEFGSDRGLFHQLCSNEKPPCQDYQYLDEEEISGSGEGGGGGEGMKYRKSHPLKVNSISIVS